MLSLLSVEKLSKHFEGVVALDRVDLSVAKGQIRGIIGPNGSGKTTLINVATGLLPTTAGKIYFDGEEITKLKPHLMTKRGISRTFQIPKILPELTCLENVMLGRHCRHGFDLLGTYLRLPFTSSRQEDYIRRKALQLLESMDLKASADRQGSDLTWVEEQLVQICRSLISEPKLLMLDEPTAGMGEVESSAIQSVIKNIRDMGVTVIVVAHDMNLIMGICDVVTCLSFGFKVAEGLPEEIRRDQNVLEVYLGTE
jgi:branched-chain amino acid transport system ATP-binding protein